MLPNVQSRRITRNALCGVADDLSNAVAHVLFVVFSGVHRLSATDTEVYRGEFSIDAADCPQGRFRGWRLSFIPALQPSLLEKTTALEVSRGARA